MRQRDLRNGPSDRRSEGRFGGRFGNLFTSDGVTDPYGAYRALRERDPIYSPTPSLRILTRHEDVNFVLRHRAMSVRPARGSESAASDAGIDPDADSLLFTDPPRHGRIRGVASPLFTPASVERFRPSVEGAVAGILDAAADRGSLDVAADLAYPIPVTAISALVGIPTSEREVFADWSRKNVHRARPDADDATIREAAKAREEVRALVSDLAEHRRRHPGPDLLSTLVAAEEGGRITRGELTAMVLLLFLAGHETTANLVSGAVLALLDHPDQLSLLRTHPWLVRRAVEEFLRFDAPVQMRGRLSTEDVEIGSRRIPSGTKILAILGAANRDPARHPDPDRLDIERPNPGHLAFGGGPHFCLGAHLARMEARVMLEGLLERFNQIELDGASGVRRRHTVGLRGVESLPVLVR